MEILEWTYYGNTLRTWSFALFVTAVIFLTLRAVQTAIGHQLRRRRARSGDVGVEGGLSAVGQSAVDRTRPLFLLILSGFLATRLLYIPAELARVLTGVVVLALVVQAGVWGNAVIARLLERVAYQRGEADPAAATTLGVLSFLARFVLWSTLVLLALRNAFGLDINALIAGLGIGGIAVALSVQRILGDLLASLSIVLDKPFMVGDFIVVGDASGTVEYIGLKTTRVRSITGEQIVFANANLLNARIHNYQAMRERRVVFTFAVHIDTPAATLSAIPSVVREIVEDREGARFDRAHLANLGDRSFTFEVVYHVLDPAYERFMDIQEAIHLGLLERLAEMEVALAGGSRAVHAGAVTPGRVAAEVEAEGQPRTSEEVEAEM